MSKIEKLFLFLTIWSLAFMIRAEYGSLQFIIMWSLVLVFGNAFIWVGDNGLRR